MLEKQNYSKKGRPSMEKFYFLNNGSSFKMAEKEITK